MVALNPRIKSSQTAGFTLIELSIVLVIIGLITGSILVGQDLISAAAVRSQISQIEKYQTAVNTFRSKYGYLPGDIPNPAAANYGFQSLGTPGEGDGNGVIEGVDSTGSTEGDGGTYAASGESVLFWVDLSIANLINGGFNTATTANPTLTTILGSSVSLWLPAAKIGPGNYVYVFSGGWQENYYGTSDAINYFGVATNVELNGGLVNSSSGMTIQQAYSIDSKIDDGLPQYGHVLAFDLGECGWADGNKNCGTNQAAFDPSGGPVVSGDGIKTQSGALTCYDNNNVAGATEHYSMEFNNGSGYNCALSFRFQ